MAKDFEIKTTFRAVDKTSKVLGKMQTRIARFAARAAKSMKKINRVTSKLQATMSKGLMVGAGVATTAIVGLGAALTKTAESMDLLAKQSREMNFPIEEFQEWRFVAEQSGVDSEKFSKGMMTFNKRLGKLAGGFGPLASALKKTNPELAKQLKATENSAQAMDVMVNAIRDAKSESMKSMLADAAFGLTKMSLVGMNSADTIEELRKQMRENGVVTADQAAKAEAYNDMMNRVSMTVKGFMVDVLTPLMPILTDLADRARRWAVENREIVGQKLRNGLKWLVDNFEMIIERAKQIGKGIAVFYALTTAIKVATAAMKLFQLAMNINLGPAKKAAAFMKNDMSGAIGKSTKAAGGLTKAFGALGAFAAGWEIGDTIREKLVDPIIEAQHQLHELSMEVADTQRRDLTKRSSEQLKRDLATVTKTRKALEKDVVTSYLPGMGFFKNMGRMGLNRAERRLQGAMESKSDAVIPPPAKPSVEISKTSAERVEKSEVTIKDETGRARQTKGKKGKGFKLVHSGAMP